MKYNKEKVNYTSSRELIKKISEEFESKKILIDQTLKKKTPAYVQDCHCVEGISRCDYCKIE